MEPETARRWRERVANRNWTGVAPEGSGAAAGSMAPSPAADPAARMRRLAERLRADGRRDMTRTPVYEAVAAALGPERTVLDIGAGTGRYTLPLARAGCRVWALERDGGMRQRLAEDLTALPAAAARGVTVVAGAWPEGAAAVPPVEVALACLVIHYCPDAVGFLAAMEAVATRRCVVAIRVDQVHGLAREVWPLFHPESAYPEEPVFADLYRLMLDLCICADVRVHEGARAYGRYAGLEDAVAALAGPLRLTTAAEMERLQAALRERLRPGPDGVLEDGTVVREAVVSWAPARFSMATGAARRATARGAPPVDGPAPPPEPPSGAHPRRPPSPPAAPCPRPPAAERRLR